MLVTKIKTAMAVALTVSIVGLGGGALSYSLWAGEEAGRKGQQEGVLSAGKPGEDGANKKPPPIKVKSPEAIIVGNAIASYRDKEANAPQTDKEKLQGVWKLVRLEALGKVFGADKLREVGDLAINGSRLHSANREGPKIYALENREVPSNFTALTIMVKRWHPTFELDTGKKPKRITITDEGPNGELKFNGIYSLDGDELRLCLNENGSDAAFPGEFKTNTASTFVFTTYKREKPADDQKKKEPVKVQAKPVADKERLQGTWNVVSLEVDGKKVDNDGLLPSEPISGSKWTITSDKIEVRVGDRTIEGSYTIDPSKNPKRIDVTLFVPNGEWVDQTVLLGIYALQGETLKLYLGPNQGGSRLKRPKEFQTKKDEGGALYVLQRETPGKEKQKKPDKGKENTKDLPVAERRFRQYQIECTLVQVDPTGKDLGADGKGKVLAQPELAVLEGRESNIFSGGQMAVPGDKDNAVEFLEFGVWVRVKVIGLNDGRVRLETVLERTEVDTTDQNCVLVRGNKVRSIARIKLGEAIKLVEKDDQGLARHWVRVKVVKEESITSRTPAKADSNKRPTFQEIARRLGLSEMNAFQFAEAVQGYRDAIPPLGDLARDFNMKEIDVFLLQEALRRDAVHEPENQEGNRTKGKQSGLDYRVPSGGPVALDFGFPINKAPADGKQLFSFWVGFFGH
jgi:uncharacterized protein (TIGR03067 family)